MKKYVFSLLMLLICMTAAAQTDEIHISVAMPANCILDQNAKTLLKNKLLAICTAEGIAAVECGAIAMVPEVSVLDEQLVEGGMRNIHTTELSIQVSVRNIITGTVFNSLDIAISGEGYSKMEAMRAAIKKIVPNQYTSFAATTKDKMMDYYRTNTASLITKANTLAAQQQYAEALALLSTYPESVGGYTQVSATIKQIYQQYLTQNCEEVMMSAQAAYAKRDFETAADLASTIDPTCSCFSDAKALMAKIKRDTDAIYHDEIAEQREKRKSAERIATATINAARDAAVAYYKRKTDYVFFW